MQRAGRAGRISPGHAFRLCTEEDYTRLLGDANIPEMLRSDLSSTVLQLKALGVDNFVKFRWLDAPPPESMIRALEHLHVLEAIDDNTKYECSLSIDWILMRHEQTDETCWISDE